MSLGACVYQWQMIWILNAVFQNEKFTDITNRRKNPEGSGILSLAHITIIFLGHG